MSIIFYDHLVNKQEIIVFIDNSPAPDNQKNKLKQLVDDVVHQGIVKFILNKLHPKHHKTFLSQLHNVPYDPELIDYLKEKISQDIEEQIQIVADKLCQQIKQDIGFN